MKSLTQLLGALTKTFAKGEVDTRVESRITKPQELCDKVKPVTEADWVGLDSIAVKGADPIRKPTQCKCRNNHDQHDSYLSVHLFIPVM